MAPVGLWVGALALCALAAGALLLTRRRDRAASMVLTLILAAILIAADNWDTARFEDLRSSPIAVVGLLMALAAIVAVGSAFLRWPAAFVLIAIAALPFRVPVELGGETSNLLVPLYVVLAAGAAAVAVRAFAARPASGPGERSDAEGGEPGLVSGRSERSDGDARQPGPAARWARRLLALSVVLYGLQAGYSDDFSEALEVLCFFLAPFAVLFVLLLEVRWTPALVRGVLTVAVAAALVFAVVGFWQYGARELFWNDKVIAGNEVHSWFRVNSLFWDPNILGRYLAVTLIALAVVVAWARRASTALIAAGIAAVLVVALALTFSQSSLVALLAGLAVVTALRWSVRWTAAALVFLAAAAVVAVLAGASGTDFGSDSIEAETSGRAGLISGGLDLARDRPLVGYGSGAFETTFRDRFGGGRGVSVTSHTEPITVAAEQGVIGLAVYVAFILAAGWRLLEGLRGLVPGFGQRPAMGGAGLAAEGWRAAGGWALGGVRVALVAGFAAMIVHSLAYAAFLTDPITWALLAAGFALAREPVPDLQAEAKRSVAVSAQPEPALG